MFSLGLTGGIGSGKSTVAGMLRGFGAVLIDADAISRDSTQAGGEAISAIRAKFGAELLTPDGALNREAMRALLAREPQVKAHLEAIIHPIVSAQIALQRQAALANGKKLAVLDMPLLVEGEARWRSQLDAVWVVDCLPATQMARVQSRSGWPLEQIERIMALQSSRVQRMACADAVIHNEGLSLNELRSAVQRMAAPLL